MQPVNRNPQIPPRSSRSAPRRDPAPSRAAYRMQRLWLTPFVRTALRVGLPAFVLTLGLGIYLADAGRRASISSIYTDLREKVKNRPEFMVNILAIDGASPELSEAVRSNLALPLPQSSLDIDLEAARARVTTLRAVADVDIRVQSGGILQVAVREREPAYVWRDHDGLWLIDGTGVKIAEITERSDRADLPLLAGEGADRAIAEAEQILLAAGPLLPRLRGLERLGERRWDIVLDRDQRILLPVDQPVLALERLIALDQAQDVLARDVAAVDLRLQNRPSLRLAPYALAEMRRARGIIPAESDL
ncbi:cell division protein FtsQ/DivIB [Pseudorhodobacter sp.]|uniref:cell division protein FtsQ/DivIB n=1 Tax=Pseudorhodobacter sp. TaxID=1934400 RepID=UPI002648FC61|nr:cell division protein FtsQ/DivIB [Pseudorhodobacter sp.]MDN5788635.1 cell division protein FtsQ/DivIB [Pseudorhodobacter sp.]